jgi:UDP-glucose 4-epimerase
MSLLIRDSAGYIGPHMVKYAQEIGHEVVVWDNITAGHECAAKECEVLRVDLLINVGWFSALRAVTLMM